MKSKYVDTAAVVQVIGHIFNNPSLLDIEEKYHFIEEDFPTDFHKIIFGSIYNLYTLGAKKIEVSTIEDYLSQRPRKKAIYDINKGAEYLVRIREDLQPFETFEYYYNRMKKMTLLRAYDSIGMNLSWLYDPDNIMDIKKKQKQEELLDNTSLTGIADLIDSRIESIKLRYAEGADDNASLAGEGAMELLEELKATPAVGVPLFGSLINTVTRGARLTKFYLRSASQGWGKSRAMVADSCTIACNELYDINKGEWIKNGFSEPVLYIATEQQKDEIQTMMLAFISDVDEEHILDGEYTDEEWERVVHAVDILQRSPLYTQTMPDFSLRDIENAIKIGIKEHGAKYIFFDYIFGSMKILSEVSSKAKVNNLREDNVLFMISTRLKDLCNEYGVFIMSSSQLSGDYKSAKVLDQTFLRGAKSLSDKIDIGMIGIQVNADDLVSLESLITQNGFEKPAIKLSIYKNRRGRYNNIILWCRDRRGVCKIEPMFATTYNYELVDLPDLQIKIKQ